MKTMTSIDTRLTLAAAPASKPQVAAPETPAAAPRDTVDRAAAGKPEYVPGKVLVKFDSAASRADVRSLTQRLGMTTVKHFEMPATMAKKFDGELYELQVPKGGTVEQAIRDLSGQPGVKYAEPNYRRSLNDPPATPEPAVADQKLHGANLPNDLDPKLWGIHNDGQNGGTRGVDIGAAEAWPTTTGAPNMQGPLVCIIDTGLDYNHEDLKANAWTNPGEIAGDGKDNDGNGVVDDVHGANFAVGSGDPMDDHSHGSHCAGTIAGVGNNGKGVVGVNWNATVASAKVFDGSGSTTDEALLGGIIYSGKIGARVTSNSWGGGPFSQSLHDAFQANPALHICAAGNDGSDNDANPFYPAGYDLDNIVSVAAIDKNGQLASFSNYGATTVDVAAPGVNIYSTVPGGYGVKSGTSMATPHVTGAAALLLSKFPDLTNEQLKARLMNTVERQDNLASKVVSGGRVNVANAMEEDNVAPSAPSDLGVAEAGSSSMTLRFTATGDDGQAGQAKSYQLRMSTSPILDEAAWSQASVVRGLPAPQPSGATETVRVAIPPDEQPREYFFALRVLDNLGNASPTATTSGTSLAAAVPFKDDFEADSGSWTASGTWARVDVEGRGKVYTDSPNGAYGSNADTSLTSKSISLAGVKNPRLLFSEKHDTEAGYDRVHVEVSDDGKRWTELAKYEGYGDWSDRDIDLGAYEGKSVQVRFRLTSDGSMEKDGVYVDNVRIAGDPK